MKKKTAAKKAAPKGRRKKRVLDPNWLEITQVAVLIGQTYQNTRNAMLRKVFGEPKYEGVPPKLRVARERVDAFIAKRTARLAGK